ncbi:MAG: hypothetical protein L5655_05100 [Thermosediminibacteraceae bacterium]|nr:hypothetical protein [Thermosediminibacteraceae bacterium]
MAGDPRFIDEPKFTQMLASVLERDEELARSLGEWMFEKSGQKKVLPGTSVTVLDEVQ